MNGNGSNSLALVQPYFEIGFGNELQIYEYLPGLRDDDPNDLVLMYLKTKTHYTWHGDVSHTIFSAKRWMVVPPDMVDSGTCPEGGDLVDTKELKRRVQKTITFLQEHQRPYWQAVANEQSNFLNSIKE